MVDDKKRIRVTLDPELEKELQWLMQRWDLDRNGVVSRVLSEAIREAKLEDLEAAKPLQ
jgi:hypothetical protein